MNKINIPKYVSLLIKVLGDNNYEAYIVGGCVRDVLLGVEPKDWDVTTNARPEVVKGIFEKLNYKVIETGIKHGTVTVLSDGNQVEITTYRSDGKYSDGRHPDSVEFSDSLEEDLKRRDFTINAIAYNNEIGIVDLYNGLEDILNKIIKCVDDADKRFQEDALRMLRAIRFDATKGFEIERNTYRAIVDNKDLILKVSAERIKEEIDKILLSDKAAQGLNVLKISGLLKLIIPELIPTFDCEQNNIYHYTDVWTHTLDAIKSSVNNIYVRWALLFHDIEKPACRVVGEDGYHHFYGHAIKGYDTSIQIMERMKFSNEEKEMISQLVLHHDDEYPNKNSIKRVLNKVNNPFEFIKLWIEVRGADIKAHKFGTQDKNISHLNLVKQWIEEIIKDNEAFKVKDLKLNGTDLIGVFGLKPGQIIGQILNYLLDLVVEEKVKNERELLLDEVKLYLRRDE